MYEDLMFRKTPEGWKLVSADGNYPIKVKLCGNGWAVTGIHGGGSPQKYDDEGNEYPEACYDLTFAANGQSYLMNVEVSDETINYVMVDDVEIDEFTVGCNYPVTQLLFIVTEAGDYPARDRTRHRVD